MRFANLAGRAVITDGRTAVDIQAASDGRFGSEPQELYAQWSELLDWAQGVDIRTEGCPFEVKDLGSPVPAPRQFFAVGLNYSEHADETGFDVPNGLPPVFTKFASAIVGPEATVRLPEGNVDWEIELALVIGKAAHQVPVGSAWSYIAGLTVAQDLSERVLQMSGPAPQFSLGKSHPGFAPIGPWVVTADELPDVHNLRLTCIVDGEIVQKGTTAELIFPVEVLVSRLSEVVTLLPGDVILTGTPAGVGLGRKPPRFLSAGQTLVSAIEGIGEITQRFTGED